MLHACADSGNVQDLRVIRTDADAGADGADMDARQKDTGPLPCTKTAQCTLVNKNLFCFEKTCVLSCPKDRVMCGWLGFPRDEYTVCCKQTEKCCGVFLEFGKCHPKGLACPVYGDSQVKSPDSTAQ